MDSPRGAKALCGKKLLGLSSRALQRELELAGKCHTPAGNEFLTRKVESYCGLLTKKNLLLHSSLAPHCYLCSFLLDGLDAPCQDADEGVSMPVISSFLKWGKNPFWPNMWTLMIRYIHYTHYNQAPCLHELPCCIIPFIEEQTWSLYLQIV